MLRHLHRGGNGTAWPARLLVAGLMAVVLITAQAVHLPRLHAAHVDTVHLLTMEGYSASGAAAHDYDEHTPGGCSGPGCGACIFLLAPASTAASSIERESISACVTSHPEIALGHLLRPPILLT